MNISDFAQGQIDCIECQKAQIILNADIVKLKNFVAKHKPHQTDYWKNRDGYEQYKKDLEEWDNLMRL